MTTPAPLADDTAPEGWPAGPLLAYIGDDFTGSTDVMEAFTAAGVSTVLFLQPPGPEWVQRFAGTRCIGLATTARSQGPAWMDQQLQDAFLRLQAFGAPILQYKVCSTFDSSPTVGSIGRAIDIGSRLMPGAWSPMVVAAPRLRRYQAFGNLFAVVDGQGHRLDRHPTMARHPVTPMAEADLRRHLQRQTTRRVELIDLVALQAGEGAAQLDGLLAGRASAGSPAAAEVASGVDTGAAADAAPAADAPVVLLDVIDEATLAAAGALVWQGRGAGLFSASSSGLQDALAAHWRQRGLLPAQAALPVAAPVAAIAVVSGSCSPVTGAQIGWARAHGFAVDRLAIKRVLDATQREAEVDRAVRAALAALADGRSPLVFSAEGPDDPAVRGFEASATAAGLSRSDAAERVGQALAEVMRRLLDRQPALRRIVVAGGDSSGAVAGALDIAALQVLAGLAPGAPLCRAASANPARDGLELVLKGGQMGGPSFFGLVRQGRP
jgi:3-oxoisoapionate kinase